MIILYSLCEREGVHRRFQIFLLPCLDREFSCFLRVVHRLYLLGLNILDVEIVLALHAIELTASTNKIASDSRPECSDTRELRIHEPSTLASSDKVLGHALLLLHLGLGDQGIVLGLGRIFISLHLRLLLRCQCTAGELRGHVIDIRNHLLPLSSIAIRRKTITSSLVSASSFLCLKVRGRGHQIRRASLVRILFCTQRIRTRNSRRSIGAVLDRL